VEQVESDPVIGRAPATAHAAVSVVAGGVEVVDLRPMVRVAADRHELVEQPGVLDLRDAVRLAPDPQEVVVGDLHRAGRS
jgi:hypothetical protein